MSLTSFFSVWASDSAPLAVPRRSDCSARSVRRIVTRTPKSAESNRSSNASSEASSIPAAATRTSVSARSTIRLQTPFLRSSFFLNRRAIGVSTLEPGRPRYGRSPKPASATNDPFAAQEHDHEKVGPWEGSQGTT